MLLCKSHTLRQDSTVVSALGYGPELYRRELDLGSAGRENSAVRRTVHTHSLRELLNRPIDR